MSMPIPNEFLCPITLGVMRNPVIASDGHTYEKEAIIVWFDSSSISPMTGLRILDRNVVENIALRNTIQNFLAKNPITPSTLTTSITLTTPLYSSSPLSMKYNVYKSGDQKILHMNVSATGTPSRQPISLILIVDNSGSMAEVADNEAKESFGYTRMDLVKHTIRMIGGVLSSNDTLAIITYSTTAHVVIGSTQMNEEGRAKMNAVLDIIKPESQTNIAAGISLAMEMVNDSSMDGRNIVGVLLTDGFPNINPPRGLLTTLQRKIMRNKWTLNTFGFGYNIDSALLYELAEWGNGLFGFIPDCSMVATIFINFLATILTTASTNARLTYGNTTIAPENHPVIRPAIHYIYTALETGPIMYGQSRDFVIPILDELDPICTVNGILGSPLSGTEDTSFAEGRYQYMTAIKSCLAQAKALQHEEAVGTLMAVADKLSVNSNAKAKEFIKDIRGADPEGQIGIAPRKEYYMKWGQHYMRSYLRAQNLQQCMNFKDPGLQIYGGDLFREIQTLGDKAFDDLPPPVPSGQPQKAAGGYYGGGYVPTISPRSLTQSFNNPSGGCFGGECTVLMADFTRVPIKNIVPNSTVWTPSGPANVVALVTCNTKNKSQPMSQIDSLYITPWHPIRWKGEWKLPADIAFYTERMLQTVYNLVLDKGHIVNVEGFDCVTLGHSFTEAVVAHEFFGSQRVIEDLKKVPGWSEGRPTFTNLVGVKDPITNMICEWRDVM